MRVTCALQIREVGFGCMRLRQISWATIAERSPALRRAGAETSLAQVCGGRTT